MADLVLTFARGTDSSTGKPQWQAQLNGVLYVPDMSSIRRPSETKTRWSAVQVGSRGPGVATVVLKDHLGEPEPIPLVEVGSNDIQSLGQAALELYVASDLNSEPIDLEIVRGHHKGREQWKSLVKDDVMGTSTLYVVDDDSPMLPSVGGESWRCVRSKKVYPKGADYDATGFRIVTVMLVEELAPQTGQGGADFIVKAPRTETGVIRMFDPKPVAAKKRTGTATNRGATTVGKQGQKADTVIGGWGTSKHARAQQRKRAKAHGKKK